MELKELKNEIILLSMLASSTEWTIDDIANRISKSKSTVYKHIHALEEMKFEIEPIKAGVYELLDVPKGIVDFKNLVYFTEEQAHIVHDTISSMNNANEMKGSLLRSLAKIFSRTNLSEFTFRKESSRDIARLREAIRDRKKVILKKYSSSNSGAVRDRLVEPFRLMDNYIDIWAFDLESGQNKIFRISRIGKVVITDESWTEERWHEEMEADCFRCYGKDWERVILRLNTRAKNLLAEEFPSALADLEPKGDGWILDTKVRSMKGIGRFVIGVGKDVEIIAGEPLREYILDYLDELRSSLCRDRTERKVVRRRP